mgnify:CR=1 FL=1
MGRYEKNLKKMEQIQSLIQDDPIVCKDNTRIFILSFFLLDNTFKNRKLQKDSLT